jgi:hypothetical protein
MSQHASQFLTPHSVLNRVLRKSIKLMVKEALNNFADNAKRPKVIL